MVWQNGWLSLVAVVGPKLIAYLELEFALGRNLGNPRPWAFTPFPKKKVPLHPSPPAAIQVSALPAGTSAETNTPCCVIKPARTCQIPGIHSLAQRTHQYKVHILEPLKIDQGKANRSTGRFLNGAPISWYPSRGTLGWWA